jgi:hypothetical protein
VTVEIATRSGEILEGHAEHRLGSQFAPVGRADIVEKFRLLTEPLDGVDGEAILAAVLGLDELSDTGALASLLAGA